MTDERIAGFVEANRAEYGKSYSRLRFVDRQQAVRAENRRADLLARHGVTLMAKATKPVSGPLSPGCAACLAGDWSCLFINGMCNCRCFYCPSDQKAEDPPMTQTVPFPNHEEYVEYLERFGYRGVSISGGEPLLSLEKALAFIGAVKSRFREKAHLWLYTNGVLVDRQVLERLAEAGLDEIRFDIGAREYALDKVELAVGVIPTVTVEIPAVPEELERLKELVVRMADVGVGHLNLHQLRLTPHNLPHLAARGYTFVHGSKVTVLESELTALEVLAHSAAQKGVPVNYCSYVYKNRFQSAAARKKSAALVLKPWETVTETGHIRSLGLSGSSPALDGQVEWFNRRGMDPGLWSRGSAGRELLFHPRLWPVTWPADARLRIGYTETRILPRLTYRNPFAELRLTGGRSLYIERYKVETAELVQDASEKYRQVFLEGRTTSVSGKDGPDWGALQGFEEIPGGLQPYDAAMDEGQATRSSTSSRLDS